MITAAYSTLEGLFTFVRIERLNVAINIVYCSTFRIILSNALLSNIFLMFSSSIKQAYKQLSFLDGACLYSSVTARDVNIGPFLEF